MPSWIRIRIRNLNADPDPATQINADPCGSGSGYGYGSETLFCSVSFFSFIKVFLLFSGQEEQAPGFPEVIASQKVCAVPFSNLLNVITERASQTVHLMILLVKFDPHVQAEKDPDLYGKEANLPE